jgi:hypothetical protein
MTNQLQESPLRTQWKSQKNGGRWRMKQDRRITTRTILRLSLWIVLIITPVVLFIQNQAHAIVIPIQSVRQMAFSICDSSDYRNQVVQALSSEGCAFAGGMGVNARSFLYFDGDAHSLNQMMLNLAECPVTRVTCKFEELSRACDWQVLKDDRSFQVTVNLNSMRVKRGEVSIPEIPPRRPPLEE